ncbi:MAG: LPS export ABC transporter permease LptF [Alphaproteobacteria bacterium]|nr:LPS export ABC transporter permease LptF [Alphaproteobacteria bacterium]
MDRLSLYLFRQLLTAFIFASAAVTFVVLFTQSFRLLSLVIDNASTMMVFFKLMGLSMPTMLPLVLPLSLGVAIIFVYHKLAVDSELVVMRAAGVSPMQQARPALVLAGIVTVICFIFTLWITPASNRGLVALQREVKDSYAVFLSRPGSFNDVTNGLTFYTRQRGAGGALEGILMHDVRKADMPVTIMADSGQVVDNNGETEIVIFNGRRQEIDLATGKLSELRFERYVLDINSLRSASFQRLPDPREQTLSELLNPTLEMLKRRATQENLLAELNQRLAAPLLALCYTFIGLAALLAGEFNRRGMGRRILLAAAAVVTIQATFMSVNGLVLRYIWLAFIPYLIALAPIPLSLSLLKGDMLWRRLKFLRAHRAGAS